MKKIGIIDIETTGWLKAGGKIVEVGIVSLDLDTGDKEILFNKLTLEKGVTLEVLNDSWIVKNSDLRALDVMAAKSMEVLLPEIQQVIDSIPLGATAFNRDFDFDYLEDRKIKFPKMLPCPMKVSTNICKIPYPNGRGGYKWPKVTEAYDFFFPGNDYHEAHRGADDAFHEADIVLAMYQRGLYRLPE